MKKMILSLLAVLALLSCDPSGGAAGDSGSNSQGGGPGGSQGGSPGSGEEVKIPRQGLVAEYLLGIDKAIDSSRNSNNGKVNGGPIESFGHSGRADGSYQFDGVDDYIEIKNNPTLHSDRGISISGWVNAAKYRADQEWQIIFWKGEPTVMTNSTQREYGLWLHRTGFFHFNSTPAGGTSQISYNTEPGLVPARKWIHFVCIVDNEKGEMGLYIDGKLVKDTTSDAKYGKSNIRTSSGPLVFGNSGLANPAQNSFYFKGALDDIRIYNRVLSKGEIQTLYRAK